MDGWMRHWRGLMGDGVWLSVLSVLCMRIPIAFLSRWYPRGQQPSRTCLCIHWAKLITVEAAHKSAIWAWIARGETRARENGFSEKWRGTFSNSGAVMGNHFGENFCHTNAGWFFFFWFLYYFAEFLFSLFCGRRRMKWKGYMGQLRWLAPFRYYINFCSRAR